MSKRNLPTDSSCMCSGDQNCFVLVRGGRAVVLRVSPLCVNAVNEYFYWLIIQLPLDV